MNILVVSGNNLKFHNILKFKLHINVLVGLHTNKYTRCIIDTVYILQHFEEMFKSGNFEDKWEIEKCQNPPKLRFFYYTNITSYNVQCLSFHGPSSKLIEVFKQEQARYI